MNAVRIWWREGRPLLSRWTHTKDGMDLTWVGLAANAYHHHTRWLRASWWLYVFAPYDTYWRWPWGKHQHPRRRSIAWQPSWWPRRTRVWWPTVIWCRLRGHPAGIVYYSSGTEPDTSCKNCGEEIG